MTVRLGAIALGAVGLAVGILGVLALREATLSTHEPVDPSSRVELVLRARNHHGEPGRSLDDMVEALMLTCRLEVPTELVGPIRKESAGHYRVVLQPALDQTNRRQLRGCLQDWTIENLRVDVVALEPAR